MSDTSMNAFTARVLADSIASKLNRLDAMLNRLEPIAPIHLAIAVEAGRDAIVIIEGLIGSITAEEERAEARRERAAEVNRNYAAGYIWPESGTAVNATGEAERVEGPEGDPA
jgi:hypothetical protein